MVNGQRQEAQPGLLGKCPACDHLMIAKCGKLKIWHWAHKGRLVCDPWWENETEWHRAWKGLFPAEWQEIVHTAEGGERHIADVKTHDGWVIEFQHSYLTPEERRSRDAFYQKLIWVVDGTRRKRDRAQLINAWNDGAPLGGNSQVRKAFSDHCGLLREWLGSGVPIFFDLGEKERLWWLVGKSANGLAYLHPFSRAQFIEWHRNTAQAAPPLDEFVSVVLPKLIADYESRLRAQPFTWDPLRPRGIRRPFRF
jgi:competence protein CoiA